MVVSTMSRRVDSTERKPLGIKRKNVLRIILLDSRYSKGIQKLLSPSLATSMYLYTILSGYEARDPTLE